MGVIDLILLLIILVSALLGLFRGFVGIVVGTASWLLAGWASFQFGDDAGQWLAKGAHPSMTQYLGGYALVFVGVLVGVGLIGMLIKAGIQATQLSSTDRMLGFGLGLLRGGVFACVLVMLASFTPLTAEPAWRQSILLPVLNPGARWMRAQLPHWSVPDVDLGKLPMAGDNGALDNALTGSGLKDALGHALGRPSNKSEAATTQDPANVLPANIDPAQVRAGTADPARVGSQGQARPLSQ